MINRLMTACMNVVRRLIALFARPFQWVFAKIIGVLSPVFYPFKNQIISRLSPIFLPVWQRGLVLWQNLAPREQKVISTGFVLVGLCLFWLLIWDPLYQAKQRALKQLPLVQTQQIGVVQAVAIIQAQGGVQEQTPITQQYIVDAFRSYQMETETSSSQEDRVWRLSIKKASWADFYQVWRQLYSYDDSIQIESLRLDRLGTAKNELEASKKMQMMASPLQPADPDGLFTVNVSFVRVQKK